MEKRKKEENKRKKRKKRVVKSFRKLEKIKGEKVHSQTWVVSVFQYIIV